MICTVTCQFKSGKSLKNRKNKHAQLVTRYSGLYNICQDKQTNSWEYFCNVCDLPPFCQLYLWKAFIKLTLLNPPHFTHSPRKNWKALNVDWKFYLRWFHVMENSVNHPQRKKTQLDKRFDRLPLVIFFFLFFLLFGEFF